MENEKFQIHENQQQNKTNLIELIFWIISYVSWLLLTINSCVSLGWLYRKKYMRIWNITVSKEYNYLPFQMYHMIIYMVFNFSIVIIFFGCVYLFITTLIKKNQDTIQKIISTPVRFHFFPILCAFIMFTLGEAEQDTTKKVNSIYRGGFAISLVGLLSMLFIYFTTGFDKENWKANFFIKKGVFSCLIVLFWYNVCYDIFYLHNALRPKGKKIFNWMKGCGLAFSIIFGIGSNTFAFFFKDILICFFNLLIYIGLTIYYYKYQLKKNFNINYRTYEYDYYYRYYYYTYDEYKYRLYSFNNKKNKGDGIVDIIMICISSIVLLYLIADYIKFSQMDKINELDGYISKIRTEIDSLKKSNEENNKKTEIIHNELELIISDRKGNQIVTKQDIIEN